MIVSQQRKGSNNKICKAKTLSRILKVILSPINCHCDVAKRQTLAWPPTPAVVVQLSCHKKSNINFELLAIQSEFRWSACALVKDRGSAGVGYKSSAREISCIPSSLE